MATTKFYLDRANNNIRALDEQVGSPSVAHQPQTTNQAIVLVLRDLATAVEKIRDKVERDP